MHLLMLSQGVRNLVDCHRKSEIQDPVHRFSTTTTRVAVQSPAPECPLGLALVRRVLPHSTSPRATHHLNNGGHGHNNGHDRDADDKQHQCQRPRPHAPREHSSESKSRTGSQDPPGKKDFIASSTCARPLSLALAHRSSGVACRAVARHALTDCAVAPALTPRPCRRPPPPSPCHRPRPHPHHRPRPSPSLMPPPSSLTLAHAPALAPRSRCALVPHPRPCPRTPPLVRPQCPSPSPSPSPSSPTLALALAAHAPHA